MLRCSGLPDEPAASNHSGVTRTACGVENGLGCRGIGLIGLAAAGGYGGPIMPPGPIIPPGPIMPPDPPIMPCIIAGIPSCTNPLTSRA